MSDVKVAIIGSGPYGVSIANELHARRVCFRIFGKPFSLWFDHTQDNMAIRSDWHTSEVYAPDRRYSFRAYLKRTHPEDADAILKKRIPVDIFRDYLRDTLGKLPYEIESVYVTRVNRTDGGFRILCGNGEAFNAEHVIVATGIESHRFLPPVLETFPSDSVVHAWYTKRIQGMKGKNVLVAGAGQSAAEAIAALSTGNNVTWLVRHPPVFFNEPINLPTPVFNFVLRISPLFFFIPESVKRILAKKFVESTITPDMKTVVTRKEVEQIRGDLDDLGLTRGKSGTIHSSALQKDFDAIVAATGYRYSMDSMPFLSEEIRNTVAVRRGVPRLSFRFETTIPNLYLTGGIAEPSHGPALRFIMGTYHAAKSFGVIHRRFL